MRVVWWAAILEFNAFFIVFMSFPEHFEVTFRTVTQKGVKFVVQVGDITDKGTDVALDTRATYAQALYNAGIGFFPLRGNHESKQAAAVEFARVFPQTQNGSNNSTPSDAFVTTTDDEATRPAKKIGSPFTLGSNFMSPSENLKGLSYRVDSRFSFV